MGWLYDEDITRPTVAKLKKAGFVGKHIAYDLKKSGITDPEVVQTARKEKSTIITLDPTEYTQMSNTTFKNMGGVWIVHTDKEDSIVNYMKDAVQATGFKTLKQRTGKKVNIHPTYIEVLDCRTNKTLPRYKRKKIQTQKGSEK